MACRLESILPKLVKPDQTGFVKSRYGTDNIRPLLNVIDFVQGALVLSLDAEKAFDRVEWDFLFSTLGKFNLLNNCIIQLLYSDPKATVIVNGLTLSCSALGEAQGRDALFHLYFSL